MLGSTEKKSYYGVLNAKIEKKDGLLYRDSVYKILVCISEKASMRMNIQCSYLVLSKYDYFHQNDKYDQVNEHHNSNWKQESPPE